MSGHVYVPAEQCLQQVTLFLIRYKEQNQWEASRRNEPIGCIIKVDLRPYGWRSIGYSYNGDVYREASGVEKIFVMNGKCDVIIERNTGR